MVGRAILISFPSSPSLMKYIVPISFSAFLSIRAQKLFTKTVWPSQCETKHVVGAERTLLLCLCHQRLRQREEFCPALSLLPLQGVFLHECKCCWPTLAAKSQPCRNLWRRNRDPSQYHFASVRCSCCCLSLWPVPWSLQVFGYGHLAVKLVVC